MRREEYIDYDPPFLETCPIDQAKRDEANPPITADDFLRIKEWLDDYVDSAPKGTGTPGTQKNPQGGATRGRELYVRSLFRCYVHLCTAAALRMHEFRCLTWEMVKFGPENEINIPYWCKTGRRVVFFKSDKLEELRKLHERTPLLENVQPDTPLGSGPEHWEGLLVCHVFHSLEGNDEIVGYELHRILNASSWNLLSS